MGRPQCCEKTGMMKKGPWTPEEDIILATYIQQHGPANWRAVPTNTGLSRCGKSCRLRWTNYLRPGIKRGNFSPHEENLIIHLQALLGNRWAAIASYLPERTDNDIKNYWNTHLKKLQLRRLYERSDKGRWERRLQTDINMAKRALEEALSMEKPTFLYQPNPASSYASSTENISRLLEGWMRKPSDAFQSPDSTHLSAAEPYTSTTTQAQGAEGIGPSHHHGCFDPDLHFSLLDTWLLHDFGSCEMLQLVQLDQNLF